MMVPITVVIDPLEWERYKATWKYEEWCWYEKQFARHPNFRPYGCVYLLECQNFNFKSVPVWIIEEQNKRHSR